MSLMIAFLAGGALCAVCQAFVVYTKATPPTILTVLEILGALLVPVGLFGILIHFCGGGLGVMVLCAGQAFYNLFYEILHGRFTVESAATILMFALIFALGIIAGNLKKIDRPSSE